MAIHASVKYRSLKAGVTHRGLQLSASIRKAAVAVHQKNFFASISSRQISPSFSFAKLTAIPNWQNLYLHNVHVNAERTIFPLVDSYAFLDSTFFATDKSLSDSFGLLSEPEFTLVKSQTDSFGMGDNAVVLLEILRAFTDAPSVIDVQTLSLGLSKSETLGTADIASMLISKPEIDAVNVGEQSVFGVSKPFADSASLSDQLSRAAVFQRSFSDAFVLDDFTDVNAISKYSSAAKNNVIGFFETQTFSTEKTLQDSATLSELAALSTERAALDGFSVADVFQKVTAYSRAFTESTLLSDSSITAIGKELSDATTLSEAFEKNVAYNRTPTDSVVFAEQSVAAFSKELSDAALITESIQIRTASLASSLLNASALNGSPLNN